MGCTLHLFELNGTEFAIRMRDSRPSILASMQQTMRKDGHFRKARIEKALALAEQFCNGKCDDVNSKDLLWALCWLGDSVLQRIDVENVVGVPGSFLESMAILPWLTLDTPPFVLPKATDEIPSCGYLSHQRLQQLSEAGFEELPPAYDHSVDQARRIMREVFESLAEDQRDLLAIVL